MIEPFLTQGYLNSSSIVSRMSLGAVSQLAYAQSKVVRLTFDEAHGMAWKAVQKALRNPDSWGADILRQDLGAEIYDALHARQKEEEGGA